jgi:nicotinamidase/pyrazinamidase
MKNSGALILVDLQNDFVPGGALAVREGDQVIPIANQLQPAFDLIVASKDWHPADHASFAVNHPGKKVGDVIELNGLPQVLWPAHCVQRAAGADFVPGLETNRLTRIFLKGTDREIDSYSAFFDNGHRKSTGLGEYLKQQQVRRVYVMGLATDYCVKFTALDARREGFEVTLVEDGCRGVNLKPDDSKHAVDEMVGAGVQAIRSNQLVSHGSG